MLVQLVGKFLLVAKSTISPINNSNRSLENFLLVAKSTISPINNSNSSLEFFNVGKIYDFHIKQQQQLTGKI